MNGETVFPVFATLGMWFQAGGHENANPGPELEAPRSNIAGSILAVRCFFVFQLRKCLKSFEGADENDKTEKTPDACVSLVFIDISAGRPQLSESGSQLPLPFRVVDVGYIGCSYHRGVLALDTACTRGTPKGTLAGLASKLKAHVCVLEANQRPSVA